MPIPQYALFCLMVLVSLLISLERMGTALDEADIGGFCIWTCVAGTIAGLPILL
ncbi:hypothetical protein H6F51_10925 [Cyanobacteria bacterium FACHB-DQ100]|uniref:hypothetical protein n=1 Tax=Leptolyngbya sp. DQ-M1 TaxID=2933920 RepID=UPI0019A489E6|nr:hypothetical protein [Cyanobacteria bacterium FACHB-DQ100]